MREHRRFQQLLAVYDDLSGEEKQLLESHLQRCQECTATLAAYRAIDDAVYEMVQKKLRQVAAQPVPQLLPAHARQRTSGGATGLRRDLRRLLAPHGYGLRFASAVLLLFLLMVLSALFGGWGPFEEPVLASTPTVEYQQQAPASSEAKATQVAWLHGAKWRATGAVGRTDLMPLATPALR